MYGASNGLSCGRVRVNSDDIQFDGQPFIPASAFASVMDIGSALLVTYTHKVPHPGTACIANAKGTPHWTGHKDGRVNQLEIPVDDDQVLASHAIVKRETAPRTW
jgi:hypothetical protein